MKTERIICMPQVILPSRRNENNVPSKIQHSAKSAALLTAALLALAGCSEAEVKNSKTIKNEVDEYKPINIEVIANEASQKVYEKYEPYDINKDGILDEQEQIKMKREIKYQDINKSLHLYTYEGTRKGNGLISRLNHEELIELLQKYPGIINLQSLDINTSRNILNKLVDYRIKNLKADFKPMDNFTQKAKINDPWHREDHINRIIKNPQLKEVFADNFAFNYAEYKPNVNIYGQDYINPFIRLLLPSKTTSSANNSQTSPKFVQH